MAAEVRKIMSREIGDYLKKLRKERNFTLIETSALVDLTPQAIGLFERYKRIPSVEVIKSYAKAFHIAENDLLNVRSQTVVNTVEKYGDDSPAYLKNEYSMMKKSNSDVNDLAEGLSVLRSLNLTDDEIAEVEAFINARRLLSEK